MRRKILPLVFLVYGLYSMQSLEKDFHDIRRLTVYLLLLVPGFVLFSLALRWYEDHEPKLRKRRLGTAIHWASRSLTQNITQYILMFCLPFFLAGRHWFYLGINILCLATLLWEPWWTWLVRSWIYRRSIQLWSILCASSFLLPFLWPERLKWFYPALTVCGLLAFIPGRRERGHLLAVGAGSLALALSLLAFPLSWRFPILSVWVQEPHFETDTLRSDSPHLRLGDTISADALRTLLREGHSLCCVAPIVAPQTLREKVQQEWLLDRQLVERPELKTTIAGNAEQRAFRSYYCKQNFPSFEGVETLRCELYLQNYLHLGSTSLQITP